MVSGQWILQTYDWKQILFRNLRPKDGGVVKFTNDIKPRIVGIGNVGKNDSNLMTDVMLVEELTHSLLNISQFCD